jgi:inositol transporter-like SP family MFS transporter
VGPWSPPEAFVVLTVSFVIGASWSGEVAFKIWAQELVPTLLRATVQGSALAVARVAAAAVAAVTPVVATSDPQALFAGLLVASVGATVACWWLAARAPAIGVLSPSSSAEPPAPG